eukprot:Skav228321  [mRNA]  locus=scaffold4117:135308:146147:+ [translate_table: standard]
MWRIQVALPSGQQDGAGPRAFGQGLLRLVTADGRVLEQKVVTWGDNAWGGDCSAVKEQLQDVRQLASSQRAFVALKQSGKPSVVTWGHPGYGGDSSQVQQLFHGPVLSVVATRHTNGAAFAALMSSGAVVTWGHSRYGGDATVVQHLLRTG